MVSSPETNWCSSSYDPLIAPDQERPARQVRGEIGDRLKPAVEKGCDVRFKLSDKSDWSGSLMKKDQKMIIDMTPSNDFNL